VSPSYAVDHAVIVQWLAWLDAGELAKLRAHLAGLVENATARASDPPSWPAPAPISTR